MAAPPGKQPWLWAWGSILAPGPAFSISPSRQETIFRDCHPLAPPLFILVTSMYSDADPFVILYFAVTLAIGFMPTPILLVDAILSMPGKKSSSRCQCFRAVCFVVWLRNPFGASAEFAESGLAGIIEDPLGAILCLLLVGLIFCAQNV